MKKQPDKKRTFRVTILQVLLALTVLTVITTGLLFYYRSVSIILDLSDTLTREATGKVIERTTGYLNGPAVQAQVISKYITERNIIKQHEKIWEYAWEQMKALPQIQAIFVADMAGSYVQVRRKPSLATRYIDRSGPEAREEWRFRDEHYNVVGTKHGLSDFDPRLRPWFLNTQAEPKIYWTDVYFFTTAQTPGISASYPVFDPQGKVISKVCVNTPLHSLSAFLAEQRVTPNSVMFIANAKGELLAYRDFQATTTRDQGTGEMRMALVHELEEPWLVDAFQTYRHTQVKRAAAGRHSPTLWQRLHAAWDTLRNQGDIPSLLEVFVYPSHNFSLSRTNGRNYITYGVPFPKSFASGWEVFVVLPERDLLQAVNSMRYQAVWIAVGILLIACMMGIWLASLLTRPIMRLTEETKKIRDFHLDDVVSIDSNIQEIDVMSNALLAMTHGLQSFRKYVPAALVRQLIELGKEAKLGGEEVEITTFFSDVAGFTSVSERMRPQELMHHLSEYFEHLSTIILDARGTIDKYIGDSIMAFWGAPAPQTNAAVLACRAALACQRKVAELNREWAEAGKSILHTRIGIHTGLAVVGNVGSTERMNYTAVGDSINLASRLEGINKLYGTRIIISESTYQKVADQFFCRLLDIVAVKGKTQGHKIYELIEAKQATMALSLAGYCRDYEHGIQAYLSKDWQQALAVFRDLQGQRADDPALTLFVQRCEAFQKHPASLPEPWDGTVTLLEK